MAVLSVRGLRVAVQARDRAIDLVRGVDFDLAAGETLGLIGESGSGKTLTCLALLRLLPDGMSAAAEQLHFDGHDLLSLPEAGMRRLRGRRLAMIFQDPVGAFNPAKRIGWHLRAALTRGEGGRAPEKATALLQDVGISEPERVLRRYPHQLSGGMLQRALIAMVAALRPDVIVADEPTTNLDNIVEQQILALFRDLRRRLSAAFVFITHDMAIAADICDRIAVMYAGQIVESGPAKAVLADPLHPYTQGLVATARALIAGAETLAEIPGQPPNFLDPPPGCLFAPRCPARRDGCDVPQHLRAPRPDRQVRCLLYD